MKFFWKGAQLQFKSAHDMFVETALGLCPNWRVKVKRCRSIFAGSSNNSKMLDCCPKSISRINLMLYLSFFCKHPNDWNNAITPQKSVDFSRHHDHLEEDNSKRLNAKLQLKCSWFLFSPKRVKQVGLSSSRIQHPHHKSQELVVLQSQEIVVLQDLWVEILRISVFLFQL